jgi:AcrR family transcriptional regulator
MVAEISNRQLEIIAAAGKILTESGINGLTTKNLAEKVGFGESALYRHFKGKEEIIVTMLHYLAENMDERYSKAISPNQTTEEKFRTLFQSQFYFFQKNPHFVVAVFSDGLMEESQRINAAILQIMAVKVKHLMPIVQEGQQNGTFSTALSTDELLHVIMGAFRLQMYKWRVANFQFDILQRGNTLIDSILKLIKS